jgi:hypothetical protein
LVDFLDPLGDRVQVAQHGFEHQLILLEAQMAVQEPKALPSFNPGEVPDV